jgi:hypothetical protein
MSICGFVEIEYTHTHQRQTLLSTTRIMLTFTDVLLLTSRGEIYGNENVLLCKVGRLLVVSDKGALRCYVINSTNIPVLPYVAQKLKEECLSGAKRCTEAFGVPDKTHLSDESDVSFRVGMDGTCDVIFKIDPIELKTGGEAFYNLLAKELRDSSEEHFNIFRDMVEIRNANPKRVKVYIHNGCHPPNGQIYDVVVNINTASGVLDAIPYFWDVYYNVNEEGIKYNPVLLKLPNLRPLSQSKV